MVDFYTRGRSLGGRVLGCLDLHFACFGGNVSSFCFGRFCCFALFFIWLGLVFVVPQPNLSFTDSSLVGRC